MRDDGMDSPLDLERFTDSTHLYYEPPAKLDLSGEDTATKAAVYLGGGVVAAIFFFVWITMVM